MASVPTPAERQALLFVAAVAALGVGARGWKATRRPADEPGARAALAAQIALVDSALTSGGARSRPPRATEPNRPKRARSPAPSTAPTSPAPTGPVDVDRADATTLDKLPGIGPALAQRIVDDRLAHGPFGSLEALERVRGIGPSLVARLRDHVTFSLPPRQTETEDPLARRGVRP